MTRMQCLKAFVRWLWKALWDVLHGPFTQVRADNGVFVLPLLAVQATLSSNRTHFRLPQGYRFSTRLISIRSYNVPHKRMILRKIYAPVASRGGDQSFRFTN